MPLVRMMFHGVHTTADGVLQSADHGYSKQTFSNHRRCDHCPCNPRRHRQTVRGRATSHDMWSGVDVTTLSVLFTLGSDALEEMQDTPSHALLLHVLAAVLMGLGVFGMCEASGEWVWAVWGGVPGPLGRPKQVFVARFEPTASHSGPPNVPKGLELGHFGAKKTRPKVGQKRISPKLIPDHL